jgi:hypothetical protein
MAQQLGTDIAFQITGNLFVPFGKAGEKIIYFLMIPDVEHTHNEGHITIIMLYGKGKYQEYLFR